MLLQNYICWTRTALEITLKAETLGLPSAVYFISSCHLFLHQLMVWTRYFLTFKEMADLCQSSPQSLWQILFILCLSKVSFTFYSSWRYERTFLNNEAIGKVIVSTYISEQICLPLWSHMIHRIRNSAHLFNKDSFILFIYLFICSHRTSSKSIKYIFMHIYTFV